jgi:glycosyltransferase involved in cell wall biosynthesis
VVGAEKMRLLASARVFVLPSHSENFGQAVVEALSCGTPAVVSRNCPWGSLDERGAGIWVENAPQSLAAALLRILEDDNVAARMGLAAVQLAKEYSWPSMGARLAKEYGRIVASGMPEPARAQDVEGRRPWRR